MLAGQASKIAPVAEFIGGRVAVPIIQRFQDIAVARGLALQASALGGKLRDLLLLDCIYRHFYLALEEHTLVTDYAGKPLDESAITYAHGRHFLRALDKNHTIPTRSAFSLAFKSECNDNVFELFEYGDQVDDPFSTVGRMFVQFIEPTSWVWIAFDVGPNHTISLEVGTGKLISTGPSGLEDITVEFSPEVEFAWRKYDRQIVVQVNNLHLNELSEEGRRIKKISDIESVVRL